MPMTHPVPPSLLQQIGNMTVSFSLLEMSLQNMVGVLLFGPERIPGPQMSRVVTSEMSFRGLRGLAYSSFKERFSQDEDKNRDDRMRRLMALCARIEERRNAVTHSGWCAHGLADHATRVKTTAKEGKGLKFSFNDTSAEEMEKFCQEIMSASEEVQDFTWSLLGTTAP